MPNGSTRSDADSKGSQGLFTVSDGNIVSLLVSSRAGVFGCAQTRRPPKMLKVASNKVGRKGDHQSISVFLPATPARFNSRNNKAWAASLS